MLALLLLVYAVAFLVGECLRDYLYGEGVDEQQPVADKAPIPASRVQRKSGQKWKRYSGLFILLKQKWSIPTRDWRALVASALAAFSAVVRCPVPTQV